MPGAYDFATASPGPMNYSGIAPGENDFRRPQPQYAGGGGGGGAAPQSPYGGPGGYYQGQGYFGDDPFGYTGGSILTPWTQPFQAPPGSGGGYSAPEYQPFQYGDFNYNFRDPGSFNETYQDPRTFVYDDFAAPAAFKAPTERDMMRDPGYQARMNAGSKALEASQAAKGVLKTGGAMKGMVDYAQNAGSQEYGNVYNRRKGEQETLYGQSANTYGINRGNAAENFDRNEAARHQAYATRQGAWRDNADVNLRGQELGYNVAQGTWDRNYAKARQGYDDEQQARQAAAAAASANANQSYNRALDEYKMAYDIFQNNQANQFNRLYTLGSMGYGAAQNQAGYASEYGNNATGIMGQRANAQAAGTIGSGNAWQQGLGNIGQGVMDIGMYTQANSNRQSPRYVQGPSSQYRTPQISMGNSPSRGITQQLAPWNG